MSTPRMMETPRLAGREDALREAPIYSAHRVVRAPSLTATERARRPMETAIPGAAPQQSPTSGITSSQEVFEPVLPADVPHRAPVGVRLETRLRSFEQQPDRVDAPLLDRPSGREAEVRAR